MSGTRWNPSSRYWLAIKLGSYSGQIHMRHLELYVSKLREFMQKEGIFLENATETGIFEVDLNIVEVNIVEVSRIIKQLLVNSKDKRIPVLFLIGDLQPAANVEVMKCITKSHSEEAFFFSASADEVMEMVRLNDFSQAKEWCREFVHEYIVQTEGKSAISLEPPPAENRSNQRNDYASDRQRERSSYSDEDIEFHNAESDNQDRYRDPSIDDSREEEKRQEEPKIDPDEIVGMTTFSNVQAAIDSFQTSPKNRKEQFITEIAGPFLFKRFNTIFTTLEKNKKLIQLIVMSLEAATGLNNQAAYEVLLQMTNGYFEKICSKILKEGDDSAIDILYSIMQIFLRAFEVIHRNDFHYFNESWDMFHYLLCVAPQTMWDKHPEKKIWFENSVYMIMSGNGEYEKESVPEQQEKQWSYEPSSVSFESSNKYKEKNDDGLRDLWEKSEKMEPPENFQSLSIYPKKNDLFSLEKRYLRRSIVEGKYSNSQHYLDIQFRLFREDLVAPLREGLAMYRKSGITRFDKTATEDTTYASDLIALDVSFIGGVQVRVNKGNPIRYIKLKTTLKMSNALKKHLKFGQMVVLSYDNFNDDINIGIIVERLDNDLSMYGILGLQFLENKNEIDMTRRYTLVESASYLEKYLAVLEIMLTIDQFRPLPMERYLVQMNTSRRKPLYLRTLAEEAYNKEDEELEKSYLEIYYKQNIKRQFDDENGFIKVDPSKLWRNKNRINIADDNQKKFLKVRGKMYEVDRMDEELDIEEYDLSQRRALIYALTSEMALIQGPPGTGKTFIGVEIVRTILENRGRLGTVQPILLVCYTNAALDQFLEKVLEKIAEDKRLKRITHNGPDIVRLGTKSESAMLDREAVMKRQIVQAWKEEIAKNEESEVAKCNKGKRTAAMRLGLASYVVSDAARTKILAYEVYKNVLPLKAQNEMISWGYLKRDSKNEKLHMDEVLACWLLDKNLDEDFRPPGLLPTSDDEYEETGKQRKKEEDDEDLRTLEEVFRDMNQEAVDYQARIEEDKNQRDDFDKLYETSEAWDLLKQNPEWSHKAEIFNGGGLKFIPGHKGQAREVPFDSNICKELVENRDRILRVKPLTEDEAKDIKSIYGLPKQRRWQLFVYWTNAMRAHTKQQIPGYMLKYEKDCNATTQAILDLDTAVLSKSLIIGATTTGAAKARNLLEKIGCRIVIIEEAAEVLEAHTFASLLPTLEHAVLIGDHQQLRPNLAVYELARTYNMDVSLFERLIKNNAPYITLEKQHRMHPEITNLIIKNHFYKMLKDADNVKEYPEVAGMKDRLFFWSHNFKESTGMDGVSYYNNAEIAMTTALLNYLRKQGYEFKDITVIATYSAQVESLKTRIARTFGMNADNTGPAIAVETVDSFQGKENKIIIVSLVANRMCVALTRAQHGMYIIGNAKHFANRKGHLWEDICNSLSNENKVDYGLTIKCRPHGIEQVIELPSDFETLSKDGGCRLICGTTLPCGHLCPRQCHPLNDHDEFVCKFPCTQTCDNMEFQHPCSRACSEKCGSCQRIEAITLNCGHIVCIPCHSIDKASCEQTCNKTLPCGHQCKEKCGTPCNIKKCTEQVDVDLPCGHTIFVECRNLSPYLKCTAPCEKILSCGHLCQELCGDMHSIHCKMQMNRTMPCGHRQSVECYKNLKSELCHYPITKTLSCGHTCEVPCHGGTLRRYCTIKCQEKAKCGHPCSKNCGECDTVGRHRCSQPCLKTLRCGHLCKNRCGELCSPCSESCLMSCIHLTCGQARSRDTAAIAFNRTCDQQCVLCSKTCDNKCAHRTCQRLCYEVCDVAPCDKRCSELLKCRHACLGFCGEVCPEICGTCQPKNYQRLIYDYGLNINSFYTIIKIPYCGHLFPYSFLDKYINDLGKNVPPTCPVCSDPIYNIKRYAKVTKRLAMDFYDRKELRRDSAIEEHKLKEYSQLVVKDYNDLMMKANKEKKVIDPIRNLFTPLQVDFFSSFEKNSVQKSIWKGKLECFRSLVVLSFYFVSNTARGVDYPKQIKSLTKIKFAEFVDHMINKGLVYNVVVNSITEAQTAMAKHFGNPSLCLVGVFIPRLRYLFCRILFYLTIWELHFLFEKGKSDLTDSQVRELRSLGSSFTHATEGENFYERYLNFLKYVNEKVLSGQKINLHLHSDRRAILPQL